ncbi:MAG: nucleoside kinase [Ruminococcaceae bacterium]|nr:nucleoside kinase [Oscillospiraceae bacterium]
MRVISIEEINRALKEDSAAFVARTEEAYAAQIRAIAEDIRDHAEQRPVVLLSGPSGSGKTTSAQLIEALLDGWGHETHTVSMDNYFSSFTPEQAELARAGKIDLESPNRLDIPFLNEQLEEIVACRPVMLPKYDFKATTRRDSGQVLQRKPGEIVILEGIHALNPEVIRLPEEQVCGVYVSVRTRVEVDGEILHPAYIRLLRRMLRDNVHRARSYAETAGMLQSVERGEELYIMPYKHRARFDVDTFHDYELSVLKALCTEEILQLPGLALLQKALAQLEEMDEALVPATSLVREFIGNGAFDQ